MATATYREFRVVIQRAGFRRVRLSHQMARDIPTPLFRQMLKQARLTQAEFLALLRGQ
ncbi:MAG: hypothetical protein Q7W02_24705 [Candidatus Rokubacteria bacterium]|nr:hypothetical protein [Candidatus Rokubacteria bacterium]